MIEETRPVGFVVNHFARWNGIKDSLFVDRVLPNKKDDSMSTSYQEISSLVATRSAAPEPEEVEVLLRQFVTKARETEHSLNSLAAANSTKLKNVFGRSRESETFGDLSQEISALNGVLEQASQRKRVMLGTKRGLILENLTRYMTSKINELVTRSSNATENFRKTFHRAHTMPNTLPSRKDVSNQLKLILEQQAEDEQSMERKELQELTRTISEVKTFMLRLSEMAVEQGTMIDRIDVNLKQTVQSIDKGNKNLMKAIEHQENRCISTVIKVQIGMALVLFVLLLLKYAR